MKGCAGGCLERVLGIVFLAVVLVAAWRFGPDLMDRMAGPDDVRVESSPELADAALERFGSFVEGREESVSFSGAELESVLRFRLADLFPTGVVDPEISIEDGETRLGVRVASELLPRVPELDRVRSLLPDTVPVEFRGRVLTLEGGQAIFLVHRIDAAAVPIPRRFHAAIVEAVDPTRASGLPPEAVTLPLPAGVRSLRTTDGRLVLEGGG